jgi:hypothetical protein
LLEGFKEIRNRTLQPPFHVVISLVHFSLIALGNRTVVVVGTYDDMFRRDCTEVRILTKFGFCRFCRQENAIILSAQLELADSDDEIPPLDQMGLSSMRRERVGQAEQDGIVQWNLVGAFAIGQICRRGSVLSPGSIDEVEFTKIMVICCAQIASRIIVYFAVLVLLANVLAEYMILGLVKLDKYMEWNLATNKSGFLSGFFSSIETFLTIGEFAKSTLSLILFFVVVPMIFDYIDNSSDEAAKVTVTPRGGTTTSQKEEDAKQN